MIESGDIKILIVNTFDIQGGAARASYRLHRALLAQGEDSLMLVQRKSSDDYTVLIENNKLTKYFNKLRPIIDILPVRFYRNRKKSLFSPSWFGLSGVVEKINKINPDIVHLHWITGGMMKIEDVARINAPIVWSLHDNWAFTGGCHIMWECERYKGTCGSCPMLGSDNEYDLSRRIYFQKKKNFSRKEDMTIVGLSRWINNCSKNSSLLQDKKHINLPNPIDTKVFKPFDKQKARELWSLPKDKKLVLLAVSSSTSDINKGFKQLTLALDDITDNDIELVVIGSSQPKNSQYFGFKTHYLGYLHDDVSLVTLYSAVDVMVVPSLQENLSNLIMENLACGTPVVGFNVGGNSDMIEHQVNGYLAKPFDASDLAFGIKWVLNSLRYEELCVNSREKVVREFDSVVVAERYMQLYRSCIPDVSS